jgi:transcriptional regulator with XRE-family HTH domain
MTVYDYVKVLADEKNVEIKAIETTLGFGNGTISKWGKSMPKADKLYQVAQYFNVPIEYFLTGNRPMISRVDEMEQILLEAYRCADKRGQANIIHICIEEQNKATAKGENISVG